jgi:hypothetical protein
VAYPGKRDGCHTCWEELDRSHGNRSAKGDSLSMTTRVGFNIGLALLLTMAE